MYSLDTYTVPLFLHTYAHFYADIPCCDDYIFALASAQL